MTLDRRSFLKTTVGAAALALSDGVIGTAALAASDGTDLREHFAHLGYQAIAPRDLITQHAFNGGVAYDETHDYHAEAPGGEPQKWAVMQNCARLEDIAKKDQPGTLAYFHIMPCWNNAPAHRGEVLDQALGYLTREAGLKPERFVIVSTERFQPYQDQVKAFGIGESQMVYRQLDEAVKIGDGSGYFRPDGHPMAPESHGASLHYAPEGTPIAKDPGYPPQGYLEIAEFLFEHKNAQTAKPEFFAFGVERVAMAQRKFDGGFETSRAQLLADLQAEAKRRGIDLPKAHGEFSAL
jgi:hypothetical protein